MTVYVSTLAFTSNISLKLFYLQNNVLTSHCYDVMMCICDVTDHVVIVCDIVLTSWLRYIHDTCTLFRVFSLY